MSFDADLNACAAIVERADPWRFRGAMAAPVAARRVLFPLYAFNAEVARAPWVTQEPMIAEMRLQWWRDVCEEIAQGRQVRRHEVATPLAAAIGPGEARLLDALIEARRWDVYRDAFEDEAHFADYMDRTAGNLMWVAASRLGAADEGVVRDAAYGLGVASWLCAIPALEQAGRLPLLDGTPEGVERLAREAQARLRAARAGRGKVAKATRAALLHVGLADKVLATAASDPLAVAEGRLPDPVPGDRGLWWRVISGGW